MHDAVVAGGGLAGCAAAIALARSGRSVVLVERTRQAHDKVCGEFLSGEALHYLGLLGVDVEALGAVRIERVRLAAGGRVSEAKLPFAGRSVTRRCLDEALLEAAARAGVEVRRGAAVQQVRRAQGGWAAELEDGGVEHAPNLFAATGKHDLRGNARPEGVQGDLLALKMYFTLSPEQQAELEGCVELMLFPGGYAGLQSVEGGIANLSLLVRKAEWKRIGGTWSDLLSHMERASPHLARRLCGGAARLERPLAISSIPYGWVRGEAEAGMWWLGDQAAVIPSFSGDGMSIALHSGWMAAEMCGAGATAAEFQWALHGQLRRQVGVATLVSRMLVSAPALARELSRVPGMLRVVAGLTRIQAGAIPSNVAGPR